MIKVLVLLGATGVGKSSLALKLAKDYNMEIISADSVQVYKDFNIGSAKLSEQERGGIKHYGLDIISPNQDFSVSDFVSYTKTAIDEIAKNKKIPLIVGGTGLYIKSLVEGYNLGGTEKNEAFRQEMEDLADKEGLDALYQKLIELNPYQADIDKKNKVRLIRALEIELFGSEKSKNEVQEYDFKIIALTLPREKLYSLINMRTGLMLKNGLVEETKALYDKYGDCKPLGAIGYKEVMSYLKGEISYQEMESLISQHTRNYAKRQITFLKTIKNVIYVDIEKEYQKLIGEIEEWIK